MQEEVSNLKKAKTAYIQRHQEWERCRDAARIAEQGAEIGATAENKVTWKLDSPVFSGENNWKYVLKKDYIAFLKLTSSTKTW